MERLIADGRLRASREVRDELQKGDDDCFTWARNRPDFFVDSDAAIQAVVTELMGRYFNPARPGRGIGGADPFVIALAAVQRPEPWIVVTGEKPGSADNPKIPWVCRHFRPQPIRTIGFLDLIVQESWQLT